MMIKRLLAALLALCLLIPAFAIGEEAAAPAETAAPAAAEETGAFVPPYEVPGAPALTAEGFLPEGKSERRERIGELTREKRSFILYISPHDIEKYLEELAHAFKNRNCVLCKELTKIHERYFRGTVEALSEQFKTLSPSEKKGEYVMVIEGMPDEEAFWAEMSIEQHVEHYISLGLSKMDACKAVSRDRGVGKGEIYKIING